MTVLKSILNHTNFQFQQRLRRILRISRYSAFLLPFVCFLTVTTVVQSFPTAVIPSNNHLEIPGEPLNPSDLATARKYLSDLEAGLIDEEEPNENEEEREVVLRDISRPLTTIWKNRRIPYEIDPAFTPKERGDLMNAIHSFRIDGCLVFSSKLPNPVSYEKDYVYFQKDKNDNGCLSSVGRQGGKQITVISPYCLKFGSIQHEIMHVLGFDHEHMRPDRDDHVEIKTENIEESLLPQFEKLEVSRNTVTGYDVGSILHYSNDADCKEPCELTIIAKKDNKTEMGQRKGLSENLIICNGGTCYVLSKWSRIWSYGEKDKDKIEKTYNCKQDPMGAVGSIMPPIGGNGRLASILCQDLDERCSLVRESDCGGNHTWINFNCRKTCNNCGGGECANFNPNCDEWAEQNNCQDLPEYMLIYCCQSCSHKLPPYKR